MEDPDHLLSLPDLLNEAFEHVARAESLAVLLRQSEYGGRVMEAVLKGLQG